MIINASVPKLTEAEIEYFCSYPHIQKDLVRAFIHEFEDEYNYWEWTVLDIMELQFKWSTYKVNGEPKWVIDPWSAEAIMDAAMYRARPRTDEDIAEGRKIFGRSAPDVYARSFYRSLKIMKQMKR